MRVLLLDIETAPNLVAVYQLKQTFINPQYIMADGYVLCFVAKWLGKKEVFFAKSPDGHITMLLQIHSLLREADCVVHYNGKKFDIPTLNAEFLLHGLTPIENLVQIDLYPLVRRSFNFPSNKLDYVCRRLGLGGKVKHGGWSMWKACMDKLHEGHAKAWKTMERYNRGDVVLLERLYKKLRPWFYTTHGYKRIHEFLTGLRKRP
jgi:DNA polymerase elongation subunit (family B)